MCMQVPDGVSNLTPAVALPMQEVGARRAGRLTVRAGGDVGSSASLEKYRPQVLADLEDCHPQSILNCQELVGACIAHPHGCVQQQALDSAVSNDHRALGRHWGTCFNLKSRRHVCRAQHARAAGKVSPHTS